MDNPFIVWGVFFLGMFALVLGFNALVDAGFGKFAVFLSVCFTVWWVCMGSGGGGGRDGPGSTGG